MIYLYYDRKKMELNSSTWNGNLARVIKILVLDDEISSLKKKYRSFLEKRKKKKNCVSRDLINLIISSKRTFFRSGSNDA